MDDGNNGTPIALHLHTLESLLRELISGRGVLLGDGDGLYTLKDKETRAILDWFLQNRGDWTKNANDQDSWAIVQATKSEPTEYPALTVSGVGGTRPTYRIRSVRAHHFAGLQEYGVQENVEFDLNPNATLFEAKNGAGKTSLLNAPIWCLTGKILRSQQWPQPGDTEVPIKAGEDDAEISAKSVAVSPAPPENVVQNNSGKFVPIDTWVEVVLIGADGKELPTIKRRIYLYEKGKIKQDKPNVSSLTLPPTAFATGTTMPGMLPMIEVGKSNDIGKAIAELTGFNDLRNLARRARLLRNRMTKDIANDLESKVDGLRTRFSTTWKALAQRLETHADLIPHLAEDFPFLDKGPANEEDVTKLKTHFVSLESQAFERAKEILGTEFDPNDREVCRELTQNIGPALGMIDFSAISRLDSASRLGRLKELTEVDIARAETLISAFFNEYREIAELEEKPDIAARERLYARVVDWMGEADKDLLHLDHCAICNEDLKGKTDSVTGQPVRDHLKKHIKEPSTVLSHTMEAWLLHAETRLSHELPDSLRTEMDSNLPARPSDLMTAALTEELFAERPFQGSLAPLKEKLEALCEETFDALPVFEEPTGLSFPAKFVERFGELPNKLARVHRAIAFARWRSKNAKTWTEAIKKVIGDCQGKNDTRKVSLSLSGMLVALNAVVTNALPIKGCLKDVDDIQQIFKSIAGWNNKIQDLAFTAEKVAPLLELGDLVGRQMDMLRTELHSETVAWKDLVYQHPSGTAPKHAETHVSPEGSLNFSSETKGSRVPSQHISNASDMRATLFAFLIAFWKNVRDTHGGIDLLVFDDPQELFDRDNMGRLVKALGQLTADNAQVLIASYNPDFMDKLTEKLRQTKGVEYAHRRISAITSSRPYVSHDLMERPLIEKYKIFRKSEGNDQAARGYVNELRIYIENRLSECLPERVPGTTPDDTLGPYLRHIHRLVRDMPDTFATPPFQKLINDPAFADNSDELEILNRSHHRDADTITHNEVTGLGDSLYRVKKLVDDAYMQFGLFQMGKSEHETGARPTLTAPDPLPLSAPEIHADIILDLAAFTRVIVEAEIKTSEEPITRGVLDRKALYHLNTHNFGFAADRGSILIVEAEAGPVDNNRLVLARYGDTILAGRLLRDPDRPGLVAIGSESENPLHRPPSKFLLTDSAALHKVTGILFSDVPPDLSRRAIGDAAPISEFPALEVEMAFKVTDDSAIPLALPNQIVLGGRALSPEDLSKGQDLLVAVCTSEGQQAFKRVGRPVFPGRDEIRLFESIGGKGDSIALAVEEAAADGNIPYVVSAREILGVVYLS